MRRLVVSRQGMLAGSVTQTTILIVSNREYLLIPQKCEVIVECPLLTIGETPYFIASKLFAILKQ